MINTSTLIRRKIFRNLHPDAVCDDDFVAWVQRYRRAAAAQYDSSIDHNTGRIKNQELFTRFILENDLGEG